MVKNYWYTERLAWSEIEEITAMAPALTWFRAVGFFGPNDGSVAAHASAWAGDRAYRARLCDELRARAHAHGIPFTLALAPNGDWDRRAPSSEGGTDAPVGKPAR